ncbi:hypothetical protein [Achromobacter marplatensis]|uniref:hypothetical protein n=1 Tax=Achromobacter marplatensis TaxID=470868 RepID=UPI0039F69891
MSAFAPDDTGVFQEVKRDYRDAALGYTGNLRRDPPSIVTTFTDAHKLATTPAGCLQRVRTAVCWAVACSVPLPGLRALLLRRSHARELSSATADLLGTLTLKRGTDGTGMGTAALRAVVRRISVLHGSAPCNNAIVEGTLLPILERHLSHLTDFDLRKIETGTLIDVTPREWPNADDRRIAQHVMALITCTHAKRTTLLDMSRNLQVWMDMLLGRAGPAYDLGVLSQCFCRFFCADSPTRVSRQTALLHAVDSLPDADLMMLLSALSPREVAPGVSPYQTLEFALANSTELNAVLPPSARVAALESLRQTAHRVALSRAAYSATEQRAALTQAAHAQTFVDSDNGWAG